MRKEPRIATALDRGYEISSGSFHKIFDTQYQELCVESVLSEYEFNGCVFEKVNFNQQDFDHCTLIDCVFDHCDLSNVDLNSSCFRRVEFRHCNLVGIDSSVCVMEDVLFYRCNARLSNLSNSQIKNCEWKENRMDECSMNDCRIKGLTVDNCVFTGAEFLHTSLNKIDFSTSVIEGIALSGPELKGIIVSPYQAVDLAKILGIVVKE